MDVRFALTRLLKGLDPLVVVVEVTAGALVEVKEEGTGVAMVSSSRAATEEAVVVMVIRFFDAPRDEVETD